MIAAPQVRAKTTTDGLLLLNVETGSIMSANHVGARIWELIEQGVATDRIATQIAAEFQAPTDIVASDVQEFLGQLRAHAAVLEESSGA